MKNIVIFINMKLKNKEIKNSLNTIKFIFLKKKKQKNLKNHFTK
jgi:hypothetical protein